MQRCKEALKQAKEALLFAQEEKAASDSELKAARAAATPAPPPPEHSQGESGLTLSSEDMVGLHDMLQQCGLLVERPQAAPRGNETKPNRIQPLSAS